MVATFHHSEWDRRELAERREESVSVLVPALDEEGTIGRIVEAVLTLDGLVDEVIVLDADSSDRTAERAAAAGAQVIRPSELHPRLGPLRGKGDGMWRGLSAARGDVVCFLDGDTVGFEPHFVTGLLGPLLTAPAIEFVKAAYRRPFRGIADEGGRVTHLCALPLLRRFHPELAAFTQPLAGEVAARRALLEAIPFATGFAVETAMLIDVHARAGIDAMAQVQLGERRQTHQPLSALGGMADTVVATVLDRAGIGGAARGPRIVERPPLAALRSAA